MKNETFIFEGLGFPIVLINAPWKKKLGEWVLDINLKLLQNLAIKTLIQKPVLLNSGEIKFIRKFFGLSASEFGRLFRVTHASVLKWESGKSLISPSTETCIRLYVMDRIDSKDKEFRKFYQDLKNHQKKRSKDILPLEINLSEQLCNSAS